MTLRWMYSGGIPAPQHHPLATDAKDGGGSERRRTHLRSERGSGAGGADWAVAGEGDG